MLNSCPYRTEKQLVQLVVISVAQTPLLVVSCYIGMIVQQLLVVNASFVLQRS